MKNLLLVILTVGLLGCPRPEEQPSLRPVPPARRLVEKPYVFTLNGKPIRPEVLSATGDPAHPRRGDVVIVNRVALMLGAQRTCHFIVTKAQPHRILVKKPGGKLAVVGVTVTSDYDGDKRVIKNPLASLSPGVIRSLWGLRVDAWPRGIDLQLRHVEASKACVTVTEAVAQKPGNRLPPLPSALVCLRIDESSSEGMKEHRELRKLRQLRFFTLRTPVFAPFDVAHLRGARSLRHVDLGVQPLKNVASLAALTELRFLNLEYSDGVRSIAFVRGMRQLRSLSIQGTKVSDLRPIVGLEKLHTVEADRSKVRRLPLVKLPKLRTLRIMSTPMAKGTVASFRLVNPQCRVWHGWVEAFQFAARGVTRIRVRSGGTCHRDKSREKTLAEVRDAREIKEVLRNLQFSEPERASRCMCCGNPSIELYRGPKLVVTLGVHHGHAVRWLGGWPGDAPLVAGSGGYLARWLARRGAPELLRRQQHQQRQARAMKRRIQRYRALIGEAVWQQLRTAKTRAQYIADLKTAAKSPRALAVLFLKLFGCHDDSWNLYSGLDGLLKKTLLPQVGAATLLQAVKLAVRDPDGLRGAARWILGEPVAAKVRKRIGRALLAKLVTAGVSSPRIRNQLRTLHGLVEARKRKAIPLLLRIYRGKVKPRKLPEKQRTEPTGMVEFRPSDATVCNTCTPRAMAAHYLATLRYKAILPSVRRRVRTAKGEDLKVYEIVIKQLKKMP